MRKRITGLSPANRLSRFDHGWLDLGHIATVEVSSEDPSFPVESVFNPNERRGWRAYKGGEQQIRIIFDEPVKLHRIHLHFVERDFERTQEFTVRWSSVEGGPTKEIVRQQWNFSPTGSTSEFEDYEVSLEGVSVLELAIKPDLTRVEASATLAAWRVA